MLTSKGTLDSLAVSILTRWISLGLPFFLGQESIRCTGTTKMENIHGEKVCSNSVLSFLAKLQAQNLFWSVHDFEKETHRGQARHRLRW